MADPWKDESGKGRGFEAADRLADGWSRALDRDWEWRPGERIPLLNPPGTARFDIPPGHLPSPGECRTWIPGVPAGHQPPPYRC